MWAILISAARINYAFGFENKSTGAMGIENREKRELARNESEMVGMQWLQSSITL